VSQNTLIHLYRTYPSRVLSEKRIISSNLYSVTKGCNSIHRNRHIFLFTKMFRTVLRLPQTFILGVKLLVYKTDDTLFIAPKIKTPGTVCVLHHILGNDEHFNWTVVCFFFVSTLTKILANGRCNMSYWCRTEQFMLNLFQLNGSVKLHYFHLESELNCLYKFIGTEKFNTLFLFCYLLIPPRTACVGHYTVRPGIDKMLQNVPAHI
jgi:hypothetical protein